MWVCKLCVRLAPEKTDCSNQESRLDHTAGVRFWRIGLNLYTHTHTHTHTNTQTHNVPSSRSRGVALGATTWAAVVSRTFMMLNACVHKPAPLQLLPPADAEHKNVLLVNLPGQIRVKLLLLPPIDLRAPFHPRYTYTPLAFWLLPCWLGVRWPPSLTTATFPGI